MACVIAMSIDINGTRIDVRKYLWYRLGYVVIELIIDSGMFLINTIAGARDRFAGSYIIMRSILILR